MTKLTPKAISKYESHNDGSIAKAICKCQFCKYVRHLRQPWLGCPFKACPTCRPDLDFKIKGYKPMLSQAKGKAPDGWKFNCLYGLTNEERECLEGMKRP